MKRDLALRLSEAYNAEVTPRRAEMRRVGDALRAVIERLVITEAPLDELEEAAEALERIATAPAKHEQRSLYEGFSESANAGSPHAFFDHSPMMGRANPLAPPLRLEVRDGKVHGEARFGSAYEGPPGCVHGGYIAAAFDEVLGMAQSMSGSPGMTGTLTVRYRRPTPLQAPVRFEGELVRVEGRKILTAGRLQTPDELAAEAEAVFVSVDFARMVELMARRDEP